MRHLIHVLPRIDGAHRLSCRLQRRPSQVVSHLAAVLQMDWLQPLPTLKLLFGTARHIDTSRQLQF